MSPAMEGCFTVDGEVMGTPSQVPQSMPIAAAALTQVHQQGAVAQVRDNNGTLAPRAETRSQCKSCRSGATGS